MTLNSEASCKSGATSTIAKLLIPTSASATAVVSDAR
jgi:hypothetical protein